MKNDIDFRFPERETKMDIAKYCLIRLYKYNKNKIDSLLTVTFYDKKDGMLGNEQGFKL